MKKTICALVFFIFTFPVFTQSPRIYTVGILPFEASQGMSVTEAAEATRLIIEELNSWGVMTILEGEQARSGEYLVRGQVSRLNDQVVLSATTSEARTGRNLNNSRAQAANLRAISMEAFCTQVAENIPFPNYMLGTWRAVINMPDGPLTCIMEFRSDRTIRVLQFDTWEHNGRYSLRYQAIGDGTYTYAGYRRRTVTIERQQVQADATVSVNLILEDALPRFESISTGSLRLIFDEARTNFEFSYGAIPCGNNFSGPSVYPSENVFYTRFTKIQ